jgi:hypothetical protein
MSELLVNLHLIVTIGLIFTMPAHSMRFDLVSGITKCISEDIKSNFMTVGKYSVINPSEGFPVPDAHKITVRVMPSETQVVTIFLYVGLCLYFHICVCPMQSVFSFLFIIIFFFGFFFFLWVDRCKKILSIEIERTFFRKNMLDYILQLLVGCFSFSFSFFFS